MCESNAKGEKLWAALHDIIDRGRIKCNTARGNHSTNEMGHLQPFGAYLGEIVGQGLFGFRAKPINVHLHSIPAGEVTPKTGQMGQSEGGVTRGGARLVSRWSPTHHRPTQGTHWCKTLTFWRSKVVHHRRFKVSSSLECF